MGKQEQSFPEEAPIKLDRCERLLLRFVMSDPLKKKIIAVFKELKATPYTCLMGCLTSYLDMVSKKEIHPGDFFKGILVGIAIAHNSGQDKNLREAEETLFKSQYYN